MQQHSLLLNPVPSTTIPTPSQQAKNHSKNIIKKFNLSNYPSIYITNQFKNTHIFFEL
jgi:hypothetical protein